MPDGQQPPRLPFGIRPEFRSYASQLAGGKIPTKHIAPLSTAESRMLETARHVGASYAPKDLKRTPVLRPYRRPPPDPNSIRPKCIRYARHLAKGREPSPYVKPVTRAEGELYRQTKLRAWKRGITHRRYYLAKQEIGPRLAEDMLYGTGAAAAYTIGMSTLIGFGVILCRKQERALHDAWIARYGDVADDAQIMYVNDFREYPVCDVTVSDHSISAGLALGAGVGPSTALEVVFDRIPEDKPRHVWLRFVLHPPDNAVVGVFYLTKSTDPKLLTTIDANLACYLCEPLNMSGFHFHLGPELYKTSVQAKDGLYPTPNLVLPGGHASGWAINAWVVDWLRGTYDGMNVMGYKQDVQGWPMRSAPTLELPMAYLNLHFGIFSKDFIRVTIDNVLVTSTGPPLW